MLKTNINHIIDGQTEIDGVVIAAYHAEISTENPEAIQIQSWQYDIEKCRGNRELINEDRAQFEDAVLEIKNKIVTGY